MPSDPLLNKLCKENGLQPEDFITEKELFYLGEPDEKLQDGTEE